MRPVQSSRPARKARVASMSPNASPSPDAERAEGRAQAAHGAAGAVQVRRDGEVAGSGEPVGLLPGVDGQPEHLVQHDDPRPRPGADGRDGQVGAQLGGAARPGHGHVGHGSSWASGRGSTCRTSTATSSSPDGSDCTRASATCSTPSPLTASTA